MVAAVGRIMGQMPHRNGRVIVCSNLYANCPCSALPCTPSNICRFVVDDSSFSCLYGLRATDEVAEYFGWDVSGAYLAACTTAVLRLTHGRGKKDFVGGRPLQSIGSIIMPHLLSLPAVGASFLVDDTTQWRAGLPADSEP